MFNLHDQRDFKTKDGSYLRVARRDGMDKWTILVTAPYGPFGGQVFCVGVVAGDYSNYSFQQLSTLGTCPVVGSKSLSGCLR